MEPITSGQVRRFLELTERIDRETFQRRLDDPATLVGFLKTGRVEAYGVGKLITIKDAQKLGLLVIGPKEVNQVFSTSLKLADCPIGFTKEQVKVFVARAKADFQIDKPPFALILLTNKSSDCRPIDLLYLKEKFGKKLYSDWYINEPEAEFAPKPVRQMWVLTYLKTNPVYTDKNWPTQQDLARERQEQILTAPEEAYCQLVAEAITGQRGKQFTRDRTASVLNGNPVNAGNFNDEGLNVLHNYIPENHYSYLGVAASVISEIAS